MRVLGSLKSTLVSGRNGSAASGGTGGAVLSGAISAGTEAAGVGSKATADAAGAGVGAGAATTSGAGGGAAGDADSGCVGVTVQADTTSASAISGSWTGYFTCGTGQAATTAGQMVDDRPRTIVRALLFRNALRTSREPRPNPDVTDATPGARSS